MSVLMKQFIPAVIGRKLVSLWIAICCCSPSCFKTFLFYPKKCTKLNNVTISRMLVGRKEFVDFPGSRVSDKKNQFTKHLHVPPVHQEPI